jgi:hypothetical protein
VSSAQTKTQRPVNAVQQRLIALNLLERAVKAMTDAELDGCVAGLDEEQTKLVEQRCSGLDAATVRESMAKGRMNGLLEGISSLLADKALADCVESLGESSDNPTEAELVEVLPGLVERHSVGAVRLMMASAIMGEALASPILKGLLKTDPTLALPPAELVSITVAKPVDPDRDAKLAIRKARKDAEKAAKAKRR